MPTGLLPSMRRTALAAAVAALFHAVPAAANPGDPVGGPIAVTGYGVTPAVARDAAGDFVVVWAAKNFPDCYCFNEASVDIHAQRFAADGTPAGPAFEVATHLVQNPKLQNEKQNPAVAMDAEGDFVVAWDEYTGYLPGSVVKAQRFAADGSRSGTEILVSAHGSYPSVAMDQDGDFVVGWGAGLSLQVTLPYPLGYGPTVLGSVNTIHAQRYKANGVPSTTDMIVDTATNSILSKTKTGLSEPVVAMDAGGDFVVGWERVSSTAKNGVYSGTAEVYARLYSAKGAAQGAPFQASSLPGGVLLDSTTFGGLGLAMDGVGDFALAWTDNSAPPNYGPVPQVYLRAFRADGTARAVESLASGSGSFAERPQLAANAAGDLALSWLGMGDTGPTLCLFSVDGTPRSAAEAVFAGGLANSPGFVAVDAAGNVVVTTAFTVLGNVEDKPILAQRFSGS